MDEKAVKRPRKEEKSPARKTREYNKSSYEVEKIEKSIIKEHTILYTVKWLNWSEDDNTNEPEYQLDCDEKLMRYAANRLGADGCYMKYVDNKLRKIDDMKDRMLDIFDPLAIVGQCSMQCGSVKFCSVKTVDSRVQLLKHIRDHDQLHLLASIITTSMETLDSSWEVYETQLNHRQQQFPEYPMVRIIFPTKETDFFHSPPPLANFLFEPVTQEMLAMRDQYPNMFPDKASKLGFNKVRPFIDESYFENDPESLEIDCQGRMPRKNFSRNPRFSTTLELRQDPACGWILSTAYDIRAETPLMMMTGVIRPSSVAQQSLKSEGMAVALSSFIEIPGTGKVLDRRQFYDFSKYIPHSCNPTCHIRLVDSGNAIPDLVVYSKIDITKSRNLEISLDYYQGFVEDVNSSFKYKKDRTILKMFDNKTDFVRCMCDSRDCRKILYIHHPVSNNFQFKGVKLAVSVLHSVLALLGFISNTVLVVLAVFKTPQSIGTYSIVIIVRGVVDGLACAFDIFSQTRPIPSGLTLGLASTGICKYLSDWLCFVGYSLQLHLHTYSLHLLVVCFAFRYYVLLERYPTAVRLVVLILLVYFPSLFQAIFVLVDENSSEEVRLLVQLHHPEYSNLKDFVVNGHTDLRHFPSMFAYLLMLIPILPCYGVIYFLRRKIHVKLRHSTLRPEVKEKHRQLTLALSAQALIPMIFAVSSLFFLISQLRIVESQFLESCILLLAVLVPLLNPIFSIALIKPYREAVMRAVGLDPKEWFIAKDGSVAPGNSKMFGSFDDSSVTSVSSVFTLTGNKDPFE